MKTTSFGVGSGGLSRRSVLAGGVSACALAACGGGSGNDPELPLGKYGATTLVTDTGTAGKKDTNLAGAWGVAFNPTAVVWVNNVNTQTSTLYDGTGAVQTLVVTVPGGARGVGRPTGIVFSGSTTDFTVSNGTTTAPARFIFASETGAISGWASTVNGTNGILKVDNSARGTVYKGLAIAAEAGVNRLYAADFAGGKIDVFNGSYQPVTLAGNFANPNAVGGLAPHGIQNLGGTLYVTYALRASNGVDFVSGVNQGLVSAFDLQGRLLRTVAYNDGRLDAPLGLALAPANFGAVGGALLVGNAGSGRIKAFEPNAGTFLGALAGADGNFLQIDGLRSFAFGNGFRSQPTNSLFYAASPNTGANGAYGAITAL